MNITMKNVLISLLLIVAPLQFGFARCEDLAVQCYDQLSSFALFEREAEALNQWLLSIEGTEEVRRTLDQLVKARLSLWNLRCYLQQEIGRPVEVQEELVLRVKKAEVIVELAEKFFNRELDAFREKLKNEANAKVKELQGKLAIVEQTLNSVQIEVGPLIRYGGPQSQRCIELWEQESDLKKEHEALLQKIKHAELMAELTTKFFDREVLRIESAERVTTSPADDQSLSAEDVAIIAHIFKQLDYISVVRQQTQALLEVSLETLKTIKELRDKA